MLILAYREEPRIRYFSHACIGFHFPFLPFEILIIRAKMLRRKLIPADSRFDCGHGPAWRRTSCCNLEIPEGEEEGLKTISFHWCLTTDKFDKLWTFNFNLKRNWNFIRSYLRLDIWERKGVTSRGKLSKFHHGDYLINLKSLLGESIRFLIQFFERNETCHR